MSSVSAKETDEVYEIPFDILSHMIKQEFDRNECSPFLKNLCLTSKKHKAYCKSIGVFQKCNLTETEKAEKKLEKLMQNYMQNYMQENSEYTYISIAFYKSGSRRPPHVTYFHNSHGKSTISSRQDDEVLVLHDEIMSPTWMDAVQMVRNISLPTDHWEAHVSTGTRSDATEQLDQAFSDFFDKFM
jgi:hypothetical protein